MSRRVFACSKRPSRTRCWKTSAATVLLDAARQPDSAAGRALDSIIPIASDFTFQLALNEAIRERKRNRGLGRPRRRPRCSDGRSFRTRSASRRAIRSHGVEAEIVEGPHLPLAQWASASAICAQSSKNDQNQGTRLTEALAARGLRLASKPISRCFFHDKGDPRKQVVTAGLAKTQPDLARRFADEQARMPSLCEKRRAVLTRDRTVALLTLATEMIGRFTRRKEPPRTARLRRPHRPHPRLCLSALNRPGCTTSSTSASTICWSTRRRTRAPSNGTSSSGSSPSSPAAPARAARLRRSIFAVGDDKQSIFSFQGAAPEAFAEMHGFFKRAHEDAGLPFRPVPFRYSFRSAPVVLEAVDVVFKQPAAHAGLTVIAEATVA